MATKVRSSDNPLFNRRRAAKPRVPHISLVFCEMWDTTALNLKLPADKKRLKVKIRGIPHLAKNERDMGHPWFCCTTMVYASPFDCTIWARNLRTPSRNTPISLPRLIARKPLLIQCTADSGVWRQESRGHAVAPAHRDQFVHGSQKPRMLKLCRDAHRDGEIVMSHPGDVHARHGDDLLQILKGLRRFQQQDDANLLIGLWRRNPHSRRDRDRGQCPGPRLAGLAAHT